MKNKWISIVLIFTIFISTLLSTGINAYASWINSYDVIAEMQNPCVGNAYFEGEEIGITITVENGFSSQKTEQLTYCLTDGAGNVVETITRDVTLKAKQRMIIGYNPDIDNRYGVYTLNVTLSSGVNEKTDSVKFSYTKRAEKFLDDLGYMCHFSKPDNPGRYARIEEAKELIKESGAGWIRGEINWSQIETVKGEYVVPERFEKYIDVAVSNGQKVILMVTGGNALYETGVGSDGNPTGCLPVTDHGKQGFANFCAFVAKYFKGRVDTFEIWNEPDWCGFNGHYEWLPNETSWGWTQLANKSSEAYANLIKVVYPAMKKEYKGEEDKLTVLSGGSLPVKSDSGYLSKMLSKEGVQDYMDGVAVHPYGRDATFGDMCSGDAQDFTRQMRRVKSFTDKPIYLTEYGASSYGNSENNGIDETNDAYVGYGIHGPEGQAISLVRTYMVVTSDPQIKLLTVYNFKETYERDGVEEKFGVIDVDYTPKNAYVALSNMSDILGNAEIVNPVEANETNYAFGDRAKSYEFQDKKTGDEIFVVAAGGSQFEWGTKLKINEALDPTTGNANAVLDNDNKRLTINAYTGGSVKVLDMYGNEIKPIGGEYPIYLKPMYVVCSKPAPVKIENGNTVKISGNNANPHGFVTAVAYRKNAIGQKIEFVEQIKADSLGNYAFEFEKAPGNVYEIRVFNGTGYYNSESGIDKYDITLNYYVNGEVLQNVSDIKPGTKVKVEMIITDKMGTGNNLMAYGCVYDSTSVLLGSDTAKSVWSDNQTVLTTEVTVGNAGDASNLKFMLWDDSMKPVLNMIKSE